MKRRVLAVAVLLIGPVLGAVGTAQSGPDGPSGRAAFKKEDYFRWMKELSNWGRWGPADEIGTLNLITPEKMKQAATLVRVGTSVSLAEVQVPNLVDPASPYSGKPYSMSANVEEFRRNAATQPFTSPPPEDLALSAHGGRTHVDALAHMFYNGQGYNGLSYQVITGTGAGRGSIDKLRNGIVTRGVLVDVPRLKGVPYLPDSAHVTVQDLQDWEKRSGVRVSEGDALFIRVGHWARRRATSDQSHRSAGLDLSVVPWLRERGVAVLGSEGAHDVMPSDYQLGPAPVHWFTLVFLGMTLMDYLDLDPLSEVAAKNMRWEFLVTIAPMPIVGATGSPVNPIAVF